MEHKCYKVSSDSIAQSEAVSACASTDSAKLFEPAGSDSITCGGSAGFNYAEWQQIKDQIVNPISNGTEVQQYWIGLEYDYAYSE